SRRAARAAGQAAGLGRSRPAEDRADQGAGMALSARSRPAAPGAAAPGPGAVAAGRLGRGGGNPAADSLRGVLCRATARAVSGEMDGHTQGPLERSQRAGRAAPGGLPGTPAAGGAARNVTGRISPAGTCNLAAPFSTARSPERSSTMRLRGVLVGFWME